MKPIALSLSTDNEYKMQFDENGAQVVFSYLVVDDSIQPSQPCVAINDGTVNELVMECISAFHESRKTLFEDSEPMVSVRDKVPVTSTKKKMSPKRIECAESACDFRAEIECEGTTSSYSFKVNDGIVIGVEWDDRFWQDIGGELDAARTLFRSIIAFYKLAKLLESNRVSSNQLDSD